jgi:hypothetical protein
MAIVNRIETEIRKQFAESRELLGSQIFRLFKEGLDGFEDGGN